MKNKLIITLTLVSAVIILIATGNGRAQMPRLQATNQQVQTILNRIGTKTNAFQREIQNIRTTDNFRADDIVELVADFENATDTFRDRFDSREQIGGELTDVLNKASLVNTFTTNNRMSSRAVSQWAALKTEIETLARYYRIRWSWGQVSSQPPYSATDNQLRNLISQIESKTDVYKSEMDRSLDRSTINNTNAEDSINSYIGKFEDATDRLKERFNSRQSTGADATEVLNRARYIDQFMSRNRVSRPAQNHWASIKSNLNTLASYYRVSWNWNQQDSNYPGGGLDTRLTGTYRLNTNRSDNVANVIDSSVANSSTDQRDNMRGNLERRLASPAMIAIEKRYRTVSIASSNAPQVTFEADGVARTETNDRGRTVTTTATANNNGVMISYEGDRVNDFYVTFSPSGNNQLNVTRRIYIENQNETITVSSDYDKIASSAQWSTVNSGPVLGGNSGGINDFYIPNGTRIDAALRGTVTTKSSQSGDRFEMEVTSPGQYRGAIIEGRVAKAADSGRVSGRASISLEFDTLRMNGNTYRFAGIIESVNAANGDSVTVNNEGTVRDSSQTTQTATRAGIGAVLGAIIGAIAGGGQGAAIGAGVGAGAGAGTVLITGRDSIELGPGSTFVITATAPANVGGNRD